MGFNINDLLTEEDKAKLMASLPPSTSSTAPASFTLDDLLKGSKEVIEVGRPTASNMRIPESVGSPEMKRLSAPRLPADTMSSAPEAPTPAQMDPKVKEYISQKFNLGNYTEDARKKLVDENSEYDLGGRIQAALAAAGAGFMGQNAGAAGNAVLDRQRADKNAKLSEFDKGRANKIQDWNLDRDVTKAEREDALLARESDPMSQESKMAQELAVSMGFKGDASKLTAQQFKQFSPVMQKKYEIEQKKLSDALMRQDRQDAREDKKFEKSMKTKELSSVQAKQRGLYEQGVLADEQYRNATSKGGWDRFDPSSNFQWIDKNDWAPNMLKSDESKEAASAEDRWVEAFLRDASGAAIPPSERGAYGKDFFPRAGDSPQAIKDKEEARRIKMESARVGSGMETGHGPSGAPKSAPSGNKPSWAK